MVSKKYYDLIVIGAGTGGYTAAIKAAQKGLSVALVEKKNLGGTCLNEGCIPTKALISSAKLYKKITTSKEHGIEISNLSFDYSKMVARKDNIVARLKKGLEGIIKANKIEILPGKARFLSPNNLFIDTLALEIEAKNVIIATGSKPKKSNFHFPGKIFDSSSLLELKKRPESIVIIGGGYIGCEFAGFFSLLGTKVGIIEASSTILSGQSKSIREAISSNLKRNNVEIICDKMVSDIKIDGDKAELSIPGQKINTEIVLSATGRQYNHESLDLLKSGVKLNSQNAINVDAEMKTSVDTIYAIGDVVGKSMLAHSAAHEAEVAVSNIVGEKRKMDYRHIPSAIFSSIEAASLGFTLERAQQEGFLAKEALFPLLASGKAIASSESEGFCKIVFDEKTKKILGAETVSEHAALLIAEISLAIQNDLKIDDIANTIHIHPTEAECWHETALRALNKPLHFL